MICDVGVQTLLKLCMKIWLSMQRPRYIMVN